MPQADADGFLQDIANAGAARFGGVSLLFLVRWSFFRRIPCLLGGLAKSCLAVHDLGVQGEPFM